MRVHLLDLTLKVSVTAASKPATSAFEGCIKSSIFDTIVTIQVHRLQRHGYGYGSFPFPYHAMRRGTTDHTTSRIGGGHLVRGGRRRTGGLHRGSKCTTFIHQQDKWSGTLTSVITNRREPWYLAERLGEGWLGLLGGMPPWRQRVWQIELHETQKMSWASAFSIMQEGKERTKGGLVVVRMQPP